MSSVIFSLLDTPAYGGAEEYLISVLFHLRKKGFSVVLATNNEQVRKKCLGKIEIINLPYRLDAIGNWKGLVKYFYSLPGALLWFVRTLQKLKRNHIEEKIICVFPGFTDRLSFSPFAKLLNCRLIWLEYGPLEPTFSRNHGFPKLLYLVGRSYPDKVVTISNWTKKSLLSQGEIPQSKILVIYPGVSENKNAPTRLKSVFSVIAIARLATEKEMDLLLTAWSKIDSTRAVLHIVGDGPEKDYLERLAQTLHISKSVIFEGFIASDEKQRLLASSNLFVFPSAWELEGFGMTTIEAMMARLPVITTGYGPQSEIVSEGVNGWYFCPHNSDDLAKKIQIAMRSDDRMKFGREGVRIAEGKFSKKNMLLAWEKLISSE